MSWRFYDNPANWPCEVCGASEYSCVCPACPTCGEIGQPNCYEVHGLERTEEQIRSAIRHNPANDPWDY